MTAPLSALVVGVRSMGKAHLKALSTLPEYTIAGICDLDEGIARTAAEPYGAPVWTDLDRAFREAQPAVVAIATPDSSHAALTLRAASAPGVRAVCCEKAMATNLADARRMVAGCREAGVPLIINHQRRFAPEMLAAREMLARGDIGPLRRIHAICAGDFLGDGTHALDSALFVAGDVAVEAVEAELDLHEVTPETPLGLKMRYGHWTEAGFLARLRLAGGVEVEIQCGRRSQRRAYQDYRIEGTAGCLWRVGDIIRPNLFVRRDGHPGTHVEVPFDDAVWHAYARPAQGDEVGAWTPVTLEGDASTHAMAASYRLLARQVAGEPVSHPMSGDIALRNFETLITAYEAARLGRRLTPPVEQPRFPLDLIAEERSAGLAPTA